MLHFLDRCAWIMTSLGLALLVIGVVLVPEAGVFAQQTGTIIIGPGCDNHASCDTGCGTCIPNAGARYLDRCNGLACTCAGTPPPPNTCAGCDCLTSLSGTRCYCVPNP